MVSLNWKFVSILRHFAMNNLNIQITHDKNWKHIALLKTTSKFEPYLDIFQILILGVIL